MLTKYLFYKEIKLAISPHLKIYCNNQILIIYSQQTHPISFLEYFDPFLKTVFLLASAVSINKIKPRTTIPKSFFMIKCYQKT